jgi:D-cysteine desulfhydrase
VEPLPAALPAGSLWIKRDDLTAESYGGNKVRALEFLLGSVAPGDTVLTVGGEGSTHVLTTAFHASKLGARVHAVRWRHEMNPVALTVAEQAAGLCARVTTTRSFHGMLARVVWQRARERVHWIPMGGSTPLGTLGHVNGALELDRQITAGEVPQPARVIVPLGTGATAAGLLLGFAIAGRRIVVVGARVGPRIASGDRVRLLARATAALIRRKTGRAVPSPPRGALQVVHDVYGGAYGRALPAGERAASLLMHWRGVALDATYSAKAFAAAIALDRHTEAPLLFWLTFDGRMLSTVAK